MTVSSLTVWMCVAAAGPTSRPTSLPTTRPGKGFTITGLLKPADRIKTVRLIDREDPANFPAKQERVFTPAFDRETGRFTAQNLPRGYYDLMIETTVGRIDGVNLQDTPDPLDLAPDTGPKPPLSKDDLAWIDEYLKNMKMFENKRRLLFVGGNGQRAKALVEKIRDQETTLPAKEPEAIWRIEVWEFRKLYGTWRRKKWMVLYRQRMPIRTFRTLTWMFDPALGGLAAQPGCTTDLGEYQVPETFDPAKGRTPY